MNERIKDLIKQSYVWVKFPETFYRGDDEPHSFLDFDKEKFAELIVWECMEQVWYSREDVINGNVSEVIKDRIKKHFGVEE
jgi:hypothetical protein